MKIVKRASGDVKREIAHNGSGSRRLYSAQGDLANTAFEALTHGFLPAGATFDWHYHLDADELMLVLKGEGLVRDRDGEYGYAPGDMFIFPPNVEHSIHNPTSLEHEYIFMRLHA